MIPAPRRLASSSPMMETSLQSSCSLLSSSVCVALLSGLSLLPAVPVLQRHFAQLHAGTPPDRSTVACFRGVFAVPSNQVKSIELCTLAMSGLCKKVLSVTGSPRGPEPTRILTSEPFLIVVDRCTVEGCSFTALCEGLDAPRTLTYVARLGSYVLCPELS